MDTDARPKQPCQARRRCRLWDVGGLLLRKGGRRGRQAGSCPKEKGFREGGKAEAPTPQPTLVSWPLFLTAEPVDILKVMQLQKQPEGVRKTPGFCPQRHTGSGPETAFRISRRAQISAPTWQLFPGTPRLPAGGEG